MRRIMLTSILALACLAPAYAQTFDRPSSAEDFSAKLAAEEGGRSAVLIGSFADLPTSVESSSSTDFTVRGYGNQEVDLPHQLTAGTWTATLSIRGDNSYSIWLKAGRAANPPLLGDLLELFCKNLLCTGADHPNRKRFRVIRGGNFFIDPITSTGTWAVRFRKDASNPQPPPPDPDPPPPPPTYGPCTPTTDVLQFAGGYRVRMCYTTPNGDIGQAKAGIWASGESGLLWFFERGNAEALVKVLDGCPINGHRWVFVAPVTDLGLSLRITGPTGQSWNYTNSVGVTARSASDTQAFRCNGASNSNPDDDNTDDPPPPALPAEPINACYHRQLNTGLSGEARMSDRSTIRNLNFAIDSSFTPNTYSKIEAMIPRMIRELAAVEHRGTIKSGAVKQEEVSWGTWRTIEERAGWISVVKYPGDGRAATQAKGGQQRNASLLRSGRFHEQPWTVLISDDGWNSADVVIAHELGHAIFGLGHVSDPDNIMCTDHYVDGYDFDDHWSTRTVCRTKGRIWQGGNRDDIDFVPNLKSYVRSQLDIADTCSEN